MSGEEKGREEEPVFEAKVLRKQDGKYKLLFRDCTLEFPDPYGRWTEVERGEELIALTAHAIRLISSLIERQTGKEREEGRSP